MESIDNFYETYVSLFIDSNSFGGAIYSVSNNCLQLIFEKCTLELSRTFLFVLSAVQPRYILANAAIHDYSHLSEKFYEFSPSSDFDGIVILPNSDFAFKPSLKRVLAMNFVCIPKHFDYLERCNYISALIGNSENNKLMIRACGALLKYLDSQRIGIELESFSARIPVYSIKPFQTNYSVLVDRNAFYSLQVFNKVVHPSAFKQGQGLGSFKEGLSLFGILNNCKSRPGFLMLKHWLMNPTCDTDILEMRLDCVEFFSATYNKDIMLSLQNCIKSIVNIQSVFIKMHSSQTTISDWVSLYQTTRNFIEICKICSTLPQSIKFLGEVVKTCDENIVNISHWISKVIDFEESKTQQRFIVNSGIDEDLDNLKIKFYNLPETLTELAHEEMLLIQDTISQCSIIYLPQMGYLLAIAEDEYKRYQDSSPEDAKKLEIIFSTGCLVHCKNELTRNLDKLLGDTDCEIRDKETEIMYSLQENILERCESLAMIVDLCAELDCVLSLACAAREFNYVRPEFHDQNVFLIKNARHPLLELCSETCIANNIRSGTLQGKVGVITGPNSAGKSVYLKQIGLILIMAHIGSFVPAESAILCRKLSGIFCQLRAQESVSQDMSRFFLNLSQISQAVNYADSHSLVLIDEFGSGTARNDGLALLVSVIEHFISNKMTCPHVVVSTHFTQLHSILPSDPSLFFKKMDVLINSPGEIVYLYKLEDGVSAIHLANYLANLAELPKDILDRANEILRCGPHSKVLEKRKDKSYPKLVSRAYETVKEFMNIDLEDEKAVSHFLASLH